MWNSVCATAARITAPFDVDLLLDEHIKAAPRAAPRTHRAESSWEKQSSHSWLKHGQHNLLHRLTGSIIYIPEDLFYLHIHSSWQHCPTPTVVAVFLFLQCQQEKPEKVCSDIFNHFIVKKWNCFCWKVGGQCGDTKFCIEILMSGGLTKHCLVCIDTCCAKGQC